MSKAVFVYVQSLLVQFFFLANPFRLSDMIVLGASPCPCLLKKLVFAITYNRWWELKLLHNYSCRNYNYKTAVYKADHNTLQFELKISQYKTHAQSRQ